MVSVFFADTVSAKARHTSTMTSIILASPCGDRETMQASSAYNMPHTARLCVCVCVVCVFFPFFLGFKFVGRTSRGHTGCLIHLLSAVRALLIFLARRIQPFLSLSSTVKSNFVY